MDIPLKPRSTPDKLKYLAGILVDACDIIETQPNKAWGLVGGVSMSLIMMAEELEPGEDRQQLSAS